MWLRVSQRDSVRRSTWHGMDQIAVHDLVVLRSHAFLLLPAVTKPNADNFFLELKVLCDLRDFLRIRFGVLLEVVLESTFDVHFDAGALLAFTAPASSGNFVESTIRGRTKNV